MLSTQSVRVFPVLLALSYACSSNDPAPENDAPRGLEVVGTGQSAAALATTDDGGTVVLTTDASTYVLDIPPDALATNTVITIEEVTVPALPGSHAVRFSPDGLTFAAPALLTVDRPYDRTLLGLQFRAGVPGVEMQVASPAGSQTTMLVHHFSEGAITDPETAAPLLTEEQREQASFDANETATAQGLFARYHAFVVPAIERARFREVEVDRALRLLNEWKADVALSAIENIGVATDGGVTTFAELATEGREQLVDNTLALYNDRTAPSCIPGRDVSGVTDWARVMLALQADLALLDTTIPARGSCFVSRIVLTGPTQLAASDDTFTVNARWELEDKNGVVELAGRSIFDFAVEGASEPDTNTVTSVTGETSRLLTRPSVNRPLGVRIVATAFTDETQLEGLPAPEPGVLQVQEPVNVELSVSQAIIDVASGTSQICATAFSDELPVFDFDARFSLGAQTGSLSSLFVGSNETGQACTTYTAPADLPVTDQLVPILVTADIRSAKASSEISVTLEGSLHFAVARNPTGTVNVDVDSDTQLCVTVTESGTPEAGASVGFSVTGAGSIDPSSATTNASGQACTTYTAPSTEDDGLVVTSVLARGVVVPSPPFPINVTSENLTGTITDSLIEDIDSFSHLNGGVYEQHQIVNNNQLMTVSLKATPVGGARGYAASDVECSLSALYEASFTNSAEGIDTDGTMTTTLTSCSAEFGEGYPASKVLIVNIEQHVVSVTTGVNPTDPDSIGTEENDTSGFVGYFYTEVGGHLVFNRTLIDDNFDIPENPANPPEAYGRIHRNWDITGTLQ